MKLLVVARQFWPPNYGGAQRACELIQGLARLHDVSLAVLTRTPADSAADVPCAELYREIVCVPPAGRAPAPAARGDLQIIGRQLGSLLPWSLPDLMTHSHSPAFVAALRALGGRVAFDAVWADRACVAEEARRAGFERIMVDVPDRESELAHRALLHSGWYPSKPLYWANWLKLRQYEKQLPRRFWKVAVCKQEDREFFDADHGGSVEVVANGVGDVPLAPPELQRDGEMLFVGLLTWQPNIDAVTWFAEEILPLVRRQIPHARFHIVGLNPGPAVLRLANDTDCIVSGSVPDVTPYYDKAAIVVVPMRLGGGTKLKVIEALAREKAVVCTAFGAEGLGLRPGVDLELAEGPAAFAEACIRLLRDAPARRRLGASGRERVLTRHRWNAIVAGAARALAS